MRIWIFGLMLAIPGFADHGKRIEGVELETVHPGEGDASTGDSEPGGGVKSLRKSSANGSDGDTSGASRDGKAADANLFYDPNAKRAASASAQTREQKGGTGQARNTRTSVYYNKKDADIVSTIDAEGDVVNAKIYDRQTGQILAQWNRPGLTANDLWKLAREKGSDVKLNNGVMLQGAHERASC